jgi:hypothetical protein
MRRARAWSAHVARARLLLSQRPAARGSRRDVHIHARAGGRVAQRGEVYHSATSGHGGRQSFSRGSRRQGLERHASERRVQLLVKLAAAIAREPRGYRAVFQYTEGARLESPKPLRVSRKGILHAPSLGGLAFVPLRGRSFPAERPDAGRGKVTRGLVKYT